VFELREGDFLVFYEHCDFRCTLFLTVFFILGGGGREWFVGFFWCRLGCRVVAVVVVKLGVWGTCYDSWCG